MPPTSDPVRPADAESRALARSLISGARFAALAVIRPGTAAPFVSRIALGTDAAGVPLTLVSSLSQHAAALAAGGEVSVLVGEPGPRGDPLTHPRLTFQATPEAVARDAPEHAALRARWLEAHPKARLYVDFTDFGFVRLRPLSGALNGGFGNAYALDAADLAAPA